MKESAQFTVDTIIQHPSDAEVYTAAYNYLEVLRKNEDFKEWFANSGLAISMLETTER